jgi:hypothetical protein
MNRALSLVVKNKKEKKKEFHSVIELLLDVLISRSLRTCIKGIYCRGFTARPGLNQTGNGPTNLIALSPFAHRVRGGTKSHLKTKLYYWGYCRPCSFSITLSRPVNTFSWSRNLLELLPLVISRGNYNC